MVALEAECCALPAAGPVHRSCRTVARQSFRNAGKAYYRRYRHGITGNGGQLQHRQLYQRPISEVYTKLRDFARDYPFDPDAEDYLVNITTGTHVAQICWFLLTEARIIPARLLQLSPPRYKDADRDAEVDVAGTHSIIDLDLSRYDEIATRFASEREDAATFLKSGIVTRNNAFNRMIDRIERVVIRSTAPVLLTGPTGAGKSQLARRIYDLKRRSTRSPARLWKSIVQPCVEIRRCPLCSVM